MECTVCGRGPAAEVELHQETGLIIVRLTRKFKGPLCREHAIQASQTYLLKTLAFGWWGLISMFVNVGAVVMDAIALVRAHRSPISEGKPHVNMTFQRWEQLQTELVRRPVLETTPAAHIPAPTRPDVSGS
jgi:hypothetical protein